MILDIVGRGFPPPRLLDVVLNDSKRPAFFYQNGGEYIESVDCYVRIRYLSVIDDRQAQLVVEVFRAIAVGAVVVSFMDETDGGAGHAVRYLVACLCQFAEYC